MPHFNAMAAGNPVIATGYSGTQEFMNVENSLPLPYQLRPVFNMPGSYYEPDMTWAEPDLVVLRRHMRRVYEDREYARAIGQRARSHLAEHFGWPERTALLLQSLRELLASGRSR